MMDDRYEWQEDGSLLGQDEFLMWREWLDLRVHWHLEFWHGQRDAAYVPEDELWKCRYCAFADLCPQVKALNLQIEPKKNDEEPPKPSPPKIVDQISQEPPKPSPPKKVVQKSQEPIGSQGIMKYFKKNTPS